MTEYSIGISVDYFRPHNERQELGSKNFITVANKVVKLGGTINISRDFDLMWDYKFMIINIDKKHAEEIEVMTEVHHMSEV